MTHFQLTPARHTVKEAPYGLASVYSDHRRAPSRKPVRLRRPPCGPMCTYHMRAAVGRGRARPVTSMSADWCGRAGCAAARPRASQARASRSTAFPGSPPFPGSPGPAGHASSGQARARSAAVDRRARARYSWRSACTAFARASSRLSVWWCSRADRRCSHRLTQSRRALAMYIYVG